MVNRNIIKNLSYKLESLSDLQINDLLEILQENEQTSTHNPEILETEDELIASLSHRRENKRARQVVDWENARRGSSRPKFPAMDKQAA